MGYDWGNGPAVPDRLYQGPFSNYGADANVPGGEVVMATTPSRAIVPNYGMGLISYVSGDIGPPHLPGQCSASAQDRKVWSFGGPSDLAKRAMHLIFTGAASN